VLDLFAKLYPRVLVLAATSDLEVIFIILIITLNLHDPSLSGFDCNTRPNSLGKLYVEKLLQSTMFSRKKLQS
jgi:hypothetical protein